LEVGIFLDPTSRALSIRRFIAILRERTADASPHANSCSPVTSWYHRRQAKRATTGRDLPQGAYSRRFLLALIPSCDDNGADCVLWTQNMLLAGTWHASGTGRAPAVHPPQAISRSGHDRCGHGGDQPGPDLREKEGLSLAIADRYATLSPREREVKALVTMGNLNKQVAGEQVE
jgi:hypothetical protein